MKLRPIEMTAVLIEGFGDLAALGVFGSRWGEGSNGCQMRGLFQAEASLGPAESDANC